MVRRNRVSGSDEYYDAQSFELQNYSADESKSGLTGDSTQDGRLDLSRGRRRSSSDTSVQSFELYTPDEERRVISKLDRHVVLFMSFLYLLSFLDRSNIGNAKIAGLMHDLRLNDAKFKWLLTGFYITYIAFEWMILLYHYLTPHIYISLCVFAWGILASLQSMATTFPHMLILRLLLGVSEAAFSPGVPFYLSFFYRREELALRAGMQVSAAPLAASFAGSLAWVITRLGEGGPLAPWRLLFLVEGFPSVIVAVVAWNVIADSPETAGFLTARERKIAKVRLQGRKDKRAVKGEGETTTHRKRVNWAEIFTTFKDPKCYLTALMFLNCNISFASMPVFLPTIVHEMGYTSLTSQALSAPPYLFSFAIVLLTAFLSDRTRTRGAYVIFHALMAASSYLLLALSRPLRLPDILRYILVYPACAGFFSAITIIITWTMNNQASSEGKGVGMTILNLVGQCGPLIGTRAFPDEDGPYYGRGMGICAGAMGVVALLAVVLRWVLVRENRRTEVRQAAEDVVEGEGEESVPLAREGSRRGEGGRFVFMV